ncbi:MAG: exodeoxyribonuclease VII large subunit [Lachnospiraceae bacterium]|nr:exodeoxyribonuclease VII large subunit [Lachnospiraceae bacterium]
MPENIYTVGQLNKYIKNMFSQDYLLRNLSVRGEVSNCKYHTSGHIFFTLKDGAGSIKCVMFAGNRSGLSFKMTDGMQVVIRGYVDVYEAGGAYQLYATKITQEGEGQLFERFQRLKEELEERGMFSPEYKQEIPKNPRTIGIVTASTGAAVRDIINVSKRRNPYIRLILYPAIVQGAEAAPSIVKGIKALEKYGVDLMIVGRGGGSIEDLWAFNKEVVAQAIFDCSVPIISAVGHEVDFTIADFVADLRASTPSAAAEIAVRDIRDIDNDIYMRLENLTEAMEGLIELRRDRLGDMARILELLSPANRLKESADRLKRLSDGLGAAMEMLLDERRNRIRLLAARLEGNSPLKRLESGYAYVAGKDGRRITSVGQVKKGDELSLTLTDGYIRTTAVDIDPVIK